MIENICPECGKELIEDVKEVWCKRCGLVVEEKVSMGIEKDFDKEGHSIILSKPITLGQPLEPTEIGKYRNYKRVK
ncbi:MAG: hypothetical protein AABY22_25090 [Nanoarchaeota archaeon]